MTENNEERIEFMELLSRLWAKRITCLKFVLIGLVVGIVIAFSIPKKYTTTVVLAAESQGVSGNMGMLASMAGINLGGGMETDALPPELYPDVLNATPFVQGLLQVNVVDTDQEINTTLYDYINKYQKIAWWGYIFKVPGMIAGALSSEKPAPTKTSKLFISDEEMGIIEFLRESYSIDIDKKTGVISLDVTAQSPKISAYLADTITTHLQTYIIEQRTKKAKTDLVNMEKLYEKSKRDYYVAQQNLALFIDGNRNVISAKYKINQEKLQNEANIAYSVYNQMAQQTQMNKIKVQDDTPVFTIIQPAVEPLTASSPVKKTILFSFAFLGFVGSCLWTLRKEIIFLLQ